MWVEFKDAPNLMLAEMWKEVLEGEGLPTRILPEGDILDWAECRRRDSAEAIDGY